MKRTEKKLKSKGIKSHVPSRKNAYSIFKYDRNYVAAHYGDVSFVPFSKGSWRFYMHRYEHPNSRLYTYLDSFFEKNVGRKVDDVFHDFCRLGWKCSWEMYDYWDTYVSYRRLWYFEDEDDGVLRRNDDNARRRYRGYGHHGTLRPEPVNRLTRQQLEYNESVVVPDFGMGSSGCRRLMGTFYVEYNHKVYKCPVYHLDFSGGASYEYQKTSFGYLKLDVRQYAPVKLLGVYRRELKFEQHYWGSEVVTTFNKKLQTLDAEVVTIERGCGVLQPCVCIDCLWCLD